MRSMILSREVCIVLPIKLHPEEVDTDRQTRSSKDSMSSFFILQDNAS